MPSSSGKRKREAEEEKQKTRTSTVGCNFEKLILHDEHKKLIRDAVLRTHIATYLATRLANLHLLRLLEEGKGDEQLKPLFDANWLINVYYCISTGRGKTKLLPELQTTLRCMPEFEPVDRKGLTQILVYEGINLAAVAKNNVWMHFLKRVQSHVKRKWRLSKEEYLSMTKDARRTRTLHIKRYREGLQ